MAIYNEILAARYSRMLQKLFGMKGPQGAKQLAGEIQSVFPFFSGAENRLLESWNLFGFSFNVVAVAAQFAFAQLRNPSTSGVIAVLYKLTASETTADAPSLSFTRATTADATISQVASFDGRNIVNSSCIWSSGNQVANPVLFQQCWQAFEPANFYADILSDVIQEIPITPGMTVRLSGQTLNQVLMSSWFWRERAIEDSEKSFV